MKKGSKHTKASRLKLSNSLKKSKRFQTSCGGNAVKARSRLTKASRKKQANSLKGRKYSAAHRKAISDGVSRYCKTRKGKAEKSKRQKRAWRGNYEKMAAACLPNMLGAQAACHTPKQLASASRIATKYGHLGRKASGRGKPSKPQKQFCKLLRKLTRGLRFDSYKISANGHRYCPDIVNPKTKRAVEIDGIYWHGLTKTKKLDLLRDANLKSVGWKVLRLPAESPSLFKLKTLKRAISFLKAELA